MTKELENIPRPTQEAGDALRSAKRSSKSSTNMIAQTDPGVKANLSPRDEMVLFLEMLYGNNAQGYLTLWSLQDKKTHWFTANELASIADEAVRLARNKDVYFGVGLRREPLDEHHRGTAKDVIAIPGLWADIDVNGSAHKGLHYPPTKDAALKMVTGFPLQPTVIVDSGHGFHVWWLFKQLLVFDTEEDRQHAQRLSASFQETLQEMAAQHGWAMDSTHDLARVLRLPGTQNRKGEPVSVKVTELDESARYTPEVLARYSQAQTSKRSSKRRAGPIYEHERNSTLASIAGSIRRKGASEEEIKEVLLNVNANRCSPPLEEKEVIRIAKSISSYPTGKEQGVRYRFNLSDAGNAKRLVSQFGDDIHYCYAYKSWFVWDSTRWVRDATGEMDRLAKKIAAKIYNEVEEAQTEEASKTILSWARRSESKPRIAAMVALAQSEPNIPVVPEQLDYSPWLLNVSNGTVNLKTGELIPHQRQYLCTRLAPVAYDPKAECPTWEGFLNRVLAGDDELIRFVQRAVGYALTGSTREQVLFMLYGTGANGKSTFTEAVSAMLGDYAKHIELETLTTVRSGGIRNDIARLVGTRLVAAQEAEREHRLAEALVKNLTGEDTITSRFLYKEYFEYKPQFKLFIATNQKPVVKGSDNAIWRRIYVIVFNVFIPYKERDKDLADKLKEELPGILAWAVRGCLAWQREGLNPPPRVTAATQAYREEMNILEGFIRECCVVSATAEASAADLYNAYQKWAKKNEETVVSKRAFGSRLRTRGFVSARTSKNRMWKGIGLKQGDTVTNNDAHPESRQYEQSNNSKGSEGSCHKCHSLDVSGRQGAKDAASRADDALTASEAISNGKIGPEVTSHGGKRGEGIASNISGLREDL